MTTRQALGAIGTVLLALSVPTSAADSASIEFSAPAQASGTVEATGLTWALLVFSESSSATVGLDVPGGTLTNRTRLYRDIHWPGVATDIASSELPSRTTTLEGPVSATVAFGGDWASLYVEATSIVIRTSPARATLERSPGDKTTAEFLPHMFDRSGTFRLDIPAPSGVAMGLVGQAFNETVPVSLEADGVRRVEWHDARVYCGTPGSCPDGARESKVSASVPGGTLGVRVVPFIEVASSGGGRLHGVGNPMAIALGGSTLNAAVEGWTRFPSAKLSGLCEGAACPDPDGQTIQAQGRVVLEGLAPVEDGGNRLRSGFQGELDAARFDETPVDSVLARGVLTGAALAGVASLVVLGKLLLGLFARNSRPLLEHPNAKALHDLIHKHPGISFGGLERAAGLSHGTVQYHVKRLLDAGLVVAYGYRNSVRYFENHGRHADDWKEHAALHKPELRRLHQWLTGHPRASQAFIVRHTAEWGWKRSTTQHYLKLLHSADLVRFERTLVTVEYTAQRPRAEPPAGTTVG